MIEQRVVEVAVQRMNGSAASQDCGLLAVEQPLEIRECEKNRPKMSANFANCENSPLCQWSLIRFQGLRLTCVLRHDLDRSGVTKATSDSELI